MFERLIVAKEELECMFRIRIYKKALLKGRINDCVHGNKGRLPCVARDFSTKFFPNIVASYC